MDTIPFNVMEGYGAFEGKEAVVWASFGIGCHGYEMT
jgi:hypothetical protein